MVSIGSIGANFADVARSLIVNPLAKGLASQATAAVAAQIQKNVAAQQAATRAVNQGSGAAPTGLAAIPKPVLIGGIAAVGLVAILVIAKKKKRK